MQCSPGDGDRINSFALVSYIPDPLGRAIIAPPLIAEKKDVDIIVDCLRKTLATI